MCYMARKALTVRNFEIVMREIEGLDHGTHEYLRAIEVSKWTFCHDEDHRYGVMTTNISEAINGVLKRARRLPITVIVSATFTRSKNAFLEREEEAVKLQQNRSRWPDHVLNKFNKAHNLGMKHNVDLYNHSRKTAKVTTRVARMTYYRMYRVSLSDQECDCGKWKLDGITCSHALELCRQYVVDPRKYVPECYSTTEYALAYSSGFFTSLPDIKEWEEPNFQLRHNHDRRIRRCGRDVTSRIHNEMDWTQTRAREQCQAQDSDVPSTF
ncbi:hypothetical protein ACS0TY_023791 [Phlomoides rotata]